MMLFFSLHLASTRPTPLSHPQRQMGRGRVMFCMFSSSPLHLSIPPLRALCYSSRHRHEGRIEMCQASLSYLSFPQIHLSAFKQQNMQLTGREKWFLMASPVTRATRLLDRTTNASIVINTVKQDRQDFLWKGKHDSTSLSPFYC